MNKPAPINDVSALLTKQGAADFLKLSVRRVDELRQARSLPFVKIGGAVRFVPSDLQKFVTERRVF